MSDVNRISLIAELAETSPSGHIGRTALMKYFYFLQELRNVPLGYSFSLYSYGPFDSEVLSDLSTAEAIGLVDSEEITFNGGYGYRITSTKKKSVVRERSSAFISEHKEDIGWLIANFGSYSSAELELVSTLIFVYRERSKNGKTLSLEELSKNVQQIKPHFSVQKISKFAARLQEKGLLAL